MYHNYTSYLGFSQGSQPLYLPSESDFDAYEASKLGLYLPQNNLGAEENELDNLLEHAKQERSEIWNASRVMQGKLKYELGEDYATRAQLQIEAFPTHPPDYLHTTGAKRLRLAKDAMQGRDWINLVRDSKHLHFGSFHMYHLGISEAYEDGSLIFTPEFLSTVTEALEDHYNGTPYLWKVERGKDKDGQLGTPNFHTIGDVPDSLSKWAYEGSMILQPIRPKTEVYVLAYLKKPPIYYQTASYAHYLEFSETKTTKRMPNVAGYKYVSRK